MSKRYALGFSLLELVVAIAIIGILTSIALPAYQSYINKSHRTSAKTALLDLASRQESYYATNNTYTNAIASLGYSSNLVPGGSGGTNYYSITLSTSGTTSYTLTAAPTSVQSSDSCGSYVLDNQGNRLNSYPTTASAAAISGCW